MSDELKACPVCDKEMQRHDLNDHGENIVWCANCGLIGPNGITKADAVRMWNLRRREDALLARIAKLEEEIASNNVETAKHCLAQQKSIAVLEATIRVYKAGLDPNARYIANDLTLEQMTALDNLRKLRAREE